MTFDPRNLAIGLPQPPTAPFTLSEQPSKADYRDFLDPIVPGPSDPTTLIQLMAQQNDFLQDIAQYLRRQNADVLCAASVRGGSQTVNPNQIVDTAGHRIVFEVGNKPVTIYNLLAFSTWDGEVDMSILSMAGSGYKDGIPFAAGDVYNFNIPIGELWIKSATASVAQPLQVNGPADATHGGFFLYGFTTPDWDRIRGSIRS